MLLNLYLISQLAPGPQGQVPDWVLLVLWSPQQYIRFTRDPVKMQIQILQAQESSFLTSSRVTTMLVYGPHFGKQAPTAFGRVHDCPFRMLG